MRITPVVPRDSLTIGAPLSPCGGCPSGREESGIPEGEASPTFASGPASAPGLVPPGVSSESLHAATATPIRAAVPNPILNRRRKLRPMLSAYQPVHLTQFGAAATM